MSITKDTIQVSLEISPAQEGVKEFQEFLDRSKDINKEMRKLKRAGKENTDEFRKLKKESEELNKSFKKFDISTAKIGQLNKRASDLARTMKYELVPGSKEFVAASKEFKKIKDRLEQVNKEAGLTRSTLQEVRIAGIKMPDGIARGINGVQTAFKAFLALQIIEFFIDMFRVVDDVTKQFVKLRAGIKDFSGKTGKDLDEVAVRITAISTTFKKDQEEILKVTNSLAKQMEIDFGDALDVIETGLLANITQSDKFLEMLEEYPVFFKEMGFTAQQTLAVMSQSIEDGVYSDKGVDLFKELNDRMRELPKSAKEGLNQIGLDSNRVAKLIEKEGISAAFTVIQDKIRNIRTDSSQAGIALAGIFGEAGKDAGIEFIKQLDLTDAALNNLVDTGDEYTRQMIAQLEANEELAEAQNEVSKKFSESSGSLGIYITKTKTFLFQVAGSILDFFTQLPATGAGAQAALEEIGNKITRFFDRVYLTLQVKAKQIEKLNPFGKTSAQIDEEIAALRAKRTELAEEGVSVAQAYRTAMLAELDNIETRQKVTDALTPPLDESTVKSNAARDAKRVVAAYDEELAKAKAARAQQGGAVSGLGASTLPSSVSSTGEAEEDTSAQEERLKNKFLQQLITEQEYEDRRFELQQAAYERRLAFLKEKYGEESAAFISLENTKLEAQQDYDDNRLMLAQKTEEAKRAIQEQGVQAISGFVDATIALLSKDEQSRKKYGKAIKTLEIAKVTIAGLTEVQRIWAGAAQFGPLQTVIAAGQSIAAGFRTKAAVDEIRKTGFYDGGYTGNVGLFNDNQGRKVVGGVHAGEWVAPDWQVEHPTYGPVISWLDNMRKNGFQQGGFVGATTPPDAAGGQDLSFLRDAIMEMKNSQQEMTVAIRTKQFAVNTGQLRDALDEDYLLDARSSF